MFLPIKILPSAPVPFKIFTVPFARVPDKILQDPVEPPPVKILQFPVVLEPDIIFVFPAQLLPLLIWTIPVFVTPLPSPIRMTPDLLFDVPILIILLGSFVPTLIDFVAPTLKERSPSVVIAKSPIFLVIPKASVVDFSDGATGFSNSIEVVDVFPLSNTCCKVSVPPGGG